MKQFLADSAAHIASAVPGSQAAATLSDISDEAVRELVRSASPSLPGRFAILALGSWGAARLLPGSDLDLLVLSDAPAPALKSFVDQLLYPLWDAGVTVGHQVRGLRQQMRASREDLQTCTAALTARVVAGDGGWAGEAIGAWTADAAKRRRRLLRELAQRKRPGSPYLLEPDLKDGMGGRRDYDELVWSSIIVAGRSAPGLEALTSSGLLREDEAALAENAAETLTAARWLLQRDGFGDFFSLDAASHLGAQAAEGLQEALAITASTCDALRSRVAGQAVDTLPLSADEVFRLADGSLDDLRELERAAQSGRLESLATGSQQLMTCRRPGLGHELTVGAHCCKSAWLVSRLPEEGILGSSLRAADRHTVQVAALVHDSGKMTRGSGHADRGREPAMVAARRMGLGGAAVTDVGDLVGKHLLLAETALHEDLDDEQNVLGCASALGRRELIAPLHVLTAVDSLATGPATWTPWTSALVGRLVSRLDAAFSPEVDGPGLAQRAQDIRRQALALLPPDASLESGFLSSAPVRYLAASTPAGVVRDARLAAELSADPAAQARVSVTSGPADGTRTVTIAAPDEPQLLARLAGAIALAGLDILGFEAYPGPRGIALDRFVVTSATKRPLGTETFARLESLVDRALSDRLELAVRLEQRRLHYPPSRSAAPVVRTASSGWDTVVTVETPDRPGLLYDIARAVAETGLDVRWAKARTVDSTANDTFHVVGADGGPIESGVVGHLVMRLREVLA